VNYKRSWLGSLLNVKFGNPCKDIEYAKALWRFGAYDQANFNEIGVAFRKIGMRSSREDGWRKELELEPLKINSAELIYQVL